MNSSKQWVELLWTSFEGQAGNRSESLVGAREGEFPLLFRIGGFMARRASDPELWRELADPVGYRATELAKRLDINLRMLERQFKSLLGREPQDWLDELRIERAKELLLKDDYLCKQAAFDVHLKQASHFSRMFKLYAGMTPREFARQHRRNRSAL